MGTRLTAHMVTAHMDTGHMDTGHMDTGHMDTTHMVTAHMVTACISYFQLLSKVFPAQSVSPYHQFGITGILYIAMPCCVYRYTCTKECQKASLSRASTGGGRGGTSTTIGKL